MLPAVAATGHPSQSVWRRRAGRGQGGLEWRGSVISPQVGFRALSQERGAPEIKQANRGLEPAASRCSLTAKRFHFSAPAWLCRPEVVKRWLGCRVEDRMHGCQFALYFILKFLWKKKNPNHAKEFPTLLFPFDLLHCRKYKNFIILL